MPPAWFRHVVVPSFHRRANAGLPCRAQCLIGGPVLDLHPGGDSSRFDVIIASHRRSIGVVMAAWN